MFEIAETSGGYASTPTVLASFNGGDGRSPIAGVIADAAGDLFGTTNGGGTYGYGAVFEIVKTSDGYASTPTLLASFSVADGKYPGNGELIADAAGDLFGTTYSGGAYGDGAVFEIVKAADGYASTPTLLASFDGADGGSPNAGLIADGEGNLFGTTSWGGAHDDGTVFEIAKTGSGYARTPTVLATFNGADGKPPDAGLIADAAGDLFGATGYGGTNGHGTAFELSNAGFQVTLPPPAGSILPRSATSPPTRLSGSLRATSCKSKTRRIQTPSSRR